MQRFYALKILLETYWKLFELGDWVFSRHFVGFTVRGGGTATQRLAEVCGSMILKLSECYTRPYGQPEIEPHSGTGQWSGLMGVSSFEGYPFCFVAKKKGTKRKTTRKEGP